MAEIRVSTGPLHGLINEYLMLLEKATKIEMDKGGGQRGPLKEETQKAILDSLTKARTALLEGCQQTVYGLFLTQPD
jgi:hypothetical protein